MGVLYSRVDKVMNLCQNNDNPGPNMNSQYCRNCQKLLCEIQTILSNSKVVVQTIAEFTHEEHDSIYG